MSNRNRQSGFTLVEILIVVVILGILAAIVIPQFTSASEDAKSSSLYTQLQTIRSQLELYQTQHNGVYPALLTDADHGWHKLIVKTNTDGTDADSDLTTPEYGAYLQQAPKNPFTNKDVIVAGTTQAAGASATDGWVWDDTNKVIHAVGFDETTGIYTAH
jgi:general secretion pathway protein G